MSNIVRIINAGTVFHQEKPTVNTSKSKIIDVVLRIVSFIALMLTQSGQLFGPASFLNNNQFILNKPSNKNDNYSLLQQ